MSAPPAEERNHDWSARARGTVGDALRYTQFVGVMKRALPSAAFAVVAAVLAFFFIQRQPARVSMAYEKLGHVDSDLTMSHPRLSGQDGQGNPFVITADSAVQDAGDPKRARLKKIEADLTLRQKTWINANAAEGMVDMKAGNLALGGGIDVFSDSGYSLHTKAAVADLNKGTMDGHDAVTGQGPMGDLRADGFHFDRDSHLLTLTGHVHMTITGDKT